MADYFSVTRTLDAPRELVYDVLTKPEHFAVWFGTAEVQVPQDTLRMDVRPGGEFRAVMHLPDGNLIHWTGTYVEVDPPSHVAMTLTDQPDDEAGLPVIFDLEEVAGGTQLTVRQDRADFSEEQVDATIAGYNAFIDEIGRVLERIAA
ncbi:SRPBCC domain-containing protein [Microbacterium sp.]|uniref:SRPBCC family protein n=1 Tax=Microbacterium sp. TaxID=51671 RepID=UPI002E334CEB|nr:SRPBCC domain-containing protein [Microbacterium sp.]HEX5728321.1 SRPBCC domain-containing protein [Microbacterium sp.]